MWFVWLEIISSNFEFVVIIPTFREQTTAKKPEPPLPDKEEDEMDTDEEIEKVKREEELRNAKKSEKKVCLITANKLFF